MIYHFSTYFGALWHITPWYTILSLICCGTCDIPSLGDMTFCDISSFLVVYHSVICYLVQRACLDLRQWRPPLAFKLRQQNGAESFLHWPERIPYFISARWNFYEFSYLFEILGNYGENTLFWTKMCFFNLRKILWGKILFNWITIKICAFIGRNHSFGKNW